MLLLLQVLGRLHCQVLLLLSLLLKLLMLQRRHLLHLLLDERLLLVLHDHAWRDLAERGIVLNSLWSSLRGGEVGVLDGAIGARVGPVCHGARHVVVVRDAALMGASVKNVEWASRGAYLA